MAGTSAIFRSTAVTDTESGLASTEMIEFNAGTAPDARGNLTNSSVHYIEDISIHGTPKKHLDRIQANKLGVKEITIAGYFTAPSSAGGIGNFNNWMIQDKTNAALPRGRFGIRLDDISQLNLTPSAGTAYILYDVFIQRVEGSPNEASFVAKLYLNGTAI